jgi:MFS transporter, FHS family, glucose/mannose:H+ symporter
LKDLIRTHAGLLFAGVATFVMMGAGQSLYGPALPAFSRLFGVSLAEAGMLARIGSAASSASALMYLRGAGSRRAIRWRRWRWALGDGGAGRVVG